MVQPASPAIEAGRGTVFRGRRTAPRARASPSVTGGSRFLRMVMPPAWRPRRKHPQRRNRVELAATWFDTICPPTASPHEYVPAGKHALNTRFPFRFVA